MENGLWRNVSTRHRETETETEHSQIRSDISDGCKAVLTVIDSVSSHNKANKLPSSILYPQAIVFFPHKMVKSYLLLWPLINVTIFASFSHSSWSISIIYNPLKIPMTSALYISSMLPLHSRILPSFFSRSNNQYFIWPWLHSFFVHHR